MKTIVSSIIDFPKIEPINWDLWWNFWKENAIPVQKRGSNHNRYSGGWIGFDCYRGDNYIKFQKPYTTKYVCCRHILPSLYELTESLNLKIDLIRILQSKTPFLPHKDHQEEMCSIRTLLYNDSPGSSFYYHLNGEKIYQKIPEESNTWIYKDFEVDHGSDYICQRKKILIMYYGELEYNKTKDFFNNDKFLDFNIVIEK